MFTGFDFGIEVADVAGQITALIGNPLVLGLVTAGIALGWGGKLLGFLKRVSGRR